MEADDDGLLPEWVVYNELVNTGRPYIKHVCAVEGVWCQPALVKFNKISLEKLR
jgi:ATP-dependent RNA helicase DHX8/PRP22